MLINYKVSGLEDCKVYSFCIQTEIKSGPMFPKYPRTQSEKKEQHKMDSTVIPMSLHLYILL